MKEFLEELNKKYSMAIFDPNDPPRFWICGARREEGNKEPKIIEEHPDFFIVEETKDGFCIRLRVDKKKGNPQ